MTLSKLQFALSGTTRNKVVTDEVKKDILELVEDGKKCNAIFGALKTKYPNLKYQNVRSFLEREITKASKVEATAEIDQ